MHRATQQSHHEQISRRHRQPQRESQSSCDSPVARQADSPRDTGHRQPIFPPCNTTVTPQVDTTPSGQNHGDTRPPCDSPVAQWADNHQIPRVKPGIRLPCNPTITQQPESPGQTARSRITPNPEHDNRPSQPAQPLGPAAAATTTNQPSTSQPSAPPPISTGQSAASAHGRATSADALSLNAPSRCLSRYLAHQPQH